MGPCAAVDCRATGRRFAGMLRPNGSPHLNVVPHLKLFRHEGRFIYVSPRKFPGERDLSAGLARLFADHERID
jgi:hypothetical protein